MLGKPWTRRYIYNQKTCGRCKGVSHSQTVSITFAAYLSPAHAQAVHTWDMAARTCYACPTCQPLLPASSASPASGAPLTAAADGLTPARRAALAAASVARQPFRSHCAPDEPSELEKTPERLTVKELRARLMQRGMDCKGSKAQLLARFEEAAEDAPRNAQSDKPASAPHVQVLKAVPGLGNIDPAAGSGLPVGKGVDEEDDRSGSADELDLTEMLLSGRLTPSAALTPRQEALASATHLTPLPSEKKVAKKRARTRSANEHEGGVDVPLERGSSKGRSGTLKVTPGTSAAIAQLGPVATAAAAGAEKVRAGEGRNVEHVALHDDASDGIKRTKKRRG